MSYSIRGASYEPITIKATALSGEQVQAASINDTSTGVAAKVAVATTNDQALTSSEYALFVAALHKLVNASGRIDTLRGAGADRLSGAGVPLLSLAQEWQTTALTNVTTAVATAILAVDDPRGFQVGGTLIFEPGTDSYETATITAVDEYDVTVRFPSAGALYDHTANYTIGTFYFNQARQVTGSLGTLAVNADVPKPTYSYGVQAVTPVATPTDTLMIQGAHGKITRVKRIKIGGIASSGGGLVCQLIKRTSAGTPGSAVITYLSPMKHDSRDPQVASAVGYVQQANYTTLGTAAGVGRVGRLYLNVAATGPTSEVVWDFSSRQDMAALLRGASEYLWVNFSGASLPSGTALDFDIELEEHDAY